MSENIFMRFAAKNSAGGKKSVAPQARQTASGGLKSRKRSAPDEELDGAIVIEDDMETAAEEPEIISAVAPPPTKRLKTDNPSEPGTRVRVRTGVGIWEEALLTKGATGPR